MADKTDLRQVQEGRIQEAFKNGYMFHAFEIAVCGYANSGKTTLITRLIESLSLEFDIGYIKYNVNKFDIDRLNGFI